MPAPILGAVGNYIQSALSIQNWPEEVPRYDTNQQPINPQATVSPSTWPVVQVTIDGRRVRENTFANSYKETGNLLITVWGISREQVEPALNTIATALANAANWYERASPIGLQFAAMGFPGAWLYDLEVGEWTSEQRVNERLAFTQLCWVGEMPMKAGMHGNVFSVGA